MLKTLGVLLLAACAAQADLLVVPANAGANGNNGTVIPFAEGTADVLFQWDLAGSQFSSVPVGSTITAIGFRLESGQSTGPATDVTVGTFNLQLSTSLNAIGSLSTTVSANIGPDAVTVHSGALDLPAGSLVGGTGPNPFFLIDFTTPYTYTGGDLLFTLEVANAAATASIFLDADAVDALGDTVSNVNGGSQAEFYNYPITEVQFSAASATPEPASVLLIGSSLIFLAGYRLRVSKR